MAIKLYSMPRSSGTRVAWALEELGVPYEFVEIDLSKGAHQAPSFLALNPYGKVPALVDGDQHLFESGAILLHMGEKYGVGAGLWPSAGTQARADALSFTVWSMAELGQHLMQTLYHGWDTPFSFKPAERSKAAADYALAQLNRCLAVIDARLDGREHLLGDFTLVDVAAASWLVFGTMCGVKIDAHPRAATWFGRCTERPALKRAR